MKDSVITMSSLIGCERKNKSLVGLGRSCIILSLVSYLVVFNPGDVNPSLFLMIVLLVVLKYMNPHFSKA